MSGPTIDEWKIKQFIANIFLTASQEGSRLAEYVTPMGGLNAEKVNTRDVFVTDSVAEVEERFGRAEQTPIGTGTYDKRWLFKRSWDWFSDLRDKIDDFTTINDPESPWRVGAARKVGQRRDRIILGVKKDGTVDTERNFGFFGNAYTGVDGVTPVSLPTTLYSTVAATVPETAYVIDADLTGTANGLTVEKLRAVETVLATREVLMPSDRITMVVRRQQMVNLDREIELNHKDYRELVMKHNMNHWSWGQFDFVRFEALPRTAGTNYRRCPVWIKRYMVLGTWSTAAMTVLSHSHLKNAKQLMLDYAEAATRDHEEGVLEVLCAE